MVGMRAILGLAFLTTLTPVSHGAETLSRGERDFALSNLHATRKLFLDSIAGLTESQWKFKAAPDRWSIAECAEHIVVTEEFLGPLIRKTVQGTPQPDKRIAGPEARAKDEKIIALTVDRSHKLQAPEFAQPTGRFPSPQSVIDAFKKFRDENIHYMDTTIVDLRAFSMTHPALGPMDTYQFFLLMSAHTERHTMQILEVKAAPGYPR